MSTSNLPQSRDPSSGTSSKPATGLDHSRATHKRPLPKPGLPARTGNAGTRAQCSASPGRTSAAPMTGSQQSGHHPRRGSLGPGQGSMHPRVGTSGADSHNRDPLTGSDAMGAGSGSLLAKRVSTGSLTSGGSQRHGLAAQVGIASAGGQESRPPGSHQQPHVQSTSSSMIDAVDDGTTNKAARSTLPVPRPTRSAGPAAAPSGLSRYSVGAPMSHVQGTRVAAPRGSTASRPSAAPFSASATSSASSQFALRRQQQRSFTQRSAFGVRTQTGDRTPAAEASDSPSDSQSAFGTPPLVAFGFNQTRQRTTGRVAGKMDKQKPQDGDSLGSTADSNNETRVLLDRRRGSGFHFGLGLCWPLKSAWTNLLLVFHWFVPPVGQANKAESMSLVSNERTTLAWMKVALFSVILSRFSFYGNWIQPIVSIVIVLMVYRNFNHRRRQLYNGMPMDEVPYFSRRLPAIVSASIFFGLMNQLSLKIEGPVRITL